jgi:hypothetical protein
MTALLPRQDVREQFRRVAARGAWHFPKRLGADFIKQLTSEEQRSRYDRTVSRSALSGKEIPGPAKRSIGLCGRGARPLS